jgi:hypothetical protein
MYNHGIILAVQTPEAAMTSAQKRALRRMKDGSDARENHRPVEKSAGVRKVVHLRRISQREAHHRDRGDMVFAPKALWDNRPDRCDD